MTEMKTVTLGIGKANMEKKNMNNVTSIEPRNFVITSAPTDETLKMPWGINPPTAKPIAWGARAIFRRTTHTVELDVWDQEMVGGTDEERKALEKWINTIAVPAIKRELEESDIYPCDATQVELPIDGMMVVFSPKQSCGYLYIGIWPSEGLLAKGPSSLAVNATGKRKKGFTTRPKEPKDKKPFLAVVIEPGKKPEIRDIGDAKLETIQALVGGYIEHVPFFPKPKYTVAVNEEGVIQGLPFNRTRVINRKMAGHPGNVHHLHGTIVIYQVKGLTREQAEKIVEEWSR